MKAQSSFLRALKLKKLIVEFKALYKEYNVLNGKIDKAAESKKRKEGNDYKKAKAKRMLVKEKMLEKMASISLLMGKIDMRLTTNLHQSIEYLADLKNLKKAKDTTDKQ